MRTWSDWQARTTPVGLGGIEVPGASNCFGQNINVARVEMLVASCSTITATLAWASIAVQRLDLAAHSGYLTLSWSGCHD
jgi:hypothetical protein